jgi:DNA gyrase/topoisomerase IV subunit B
MTLTYTAEDIRVLKEMEHIVLNPGMYTDTERPTHLIEECLDNALDEALTGTASIIAVNIDTKNRIYSVIDNGRGMPLSNNTPVTVSSKLFSGAKFQDKKTAYDIASGLHGVGLCAVNALSDHFIIEIYRHKQHGLFKFEKGKLKDKSIKPYDGEVPFATKIEFKPTKDIFEHVIPDLNRIRRRLSNASAEMPKNITFVLNVDDNREIFKLTLSEYFTTECLQKDEAIIPIIVSKVNRKPEAFNIMFTYSKNGSVTPRILSSVNLLPVDGGGTHVNTLYEMLKTIFTTYGKLLKYNFQPQDTLIGLRAYIMLSLKEPKLAGQKKDRLTSKKTDLLIFTNQLKANLENYFTHNKEKLEALLQHFADYRAVLDSKKIKVAVSGKRGSTKFTKLRDCTSKFGELFVAEGESAAGGLVVCRNPTKHAILPLKGKIPNAATTKNILKHKEVGELIGSLGTGVGPGFNISSLKYSKVICATDADDDGHHIFALLTLALAILTPEVIMNGHYYYADTPLYAINEKNIFIPLWSEAEVNTAKQENRHIMRIKGLGEMRPDQLKKVLIDDTRRLIQVQFTSDIVKMTKLFSDSSEKRKLLEGVWTI